MNTDPVTSINMGSVQLSLPQMSGSNGVAASQPAPTGHGAPAATPVAGDVVDVSAAGLAASKAAAPPAQQASSSTPAAANLRPQVEVTNNHDVVVKYVDPKTNKAVSQVPTDGELRLRAAIQQTVTQLTHIKGAVTK